MGHLFSPFIIVVCNMYSLETRYKAVVHYNHFWKSLRGVSKLYKVSKSSLQRWVGKELNTKRKKKGKSQLKSNIIEFIQKTLTVNPFCKMTDLSNMLTKEFGLKRSARTASRYIRKSGMTRKKAFRMVDYSHNTEDIIEFGNRYIKANDEQVIVSIDECGFYVGDHNRFGYSKRGERLRVVGSKTLRQTKFTMIMAVTKDGVHHYEIQETNCKKVDFIRFINTMPPIHNGVLLMDNIQFHHSDETMIAIEKKGLQVLYTPPYSPRFNAIEYIFSTIKRLYRTECSNIQSKDVDDFVSLFDCVVNCQSSCHCYFDHVYRSVVTLMATEGVGMCGYD